MKRTLTQVITQALKLFIQDIKSAKWAIIIVIAYFVFLKRKLYSICPMVMFTGFPCPGCGMTRALFCILKFDFEGAWNLHPFIYPVIILFVCFCWNRYILLKKKMPVLKYCVIIIAVLMIFFYVWRMVNQFPGTPPMSYYRNNLWNRFCNLLSITNE